MPRGQQAAYRPMPLDFTVLELLPERGIVGGIHWKGRLVRDLRQQIVDNAGDGATVELTTDALAARLRSLKFAGYVADFPTAGSGGNRIWARTEAGSAFLATKDEVLA